MEMSKRTGLNFIGKILPDDQLASYVLEGRSLLEIPDSSVAYKAVKNIMKNVGYQ